MTSIWSATAKLGEHPTALLEASRPGSLCWVEKLALCASCHQPCDWPSLVRQDHPSGLSCLILLRCCIWKHTFRHIWRGERGKSQPWNRALVNVSCLLTLLFGSKLRCKATGVQVWSLGCGQGRWIIVPLWECRCLGGWAVPDYLLPAQALPAQPHCNELAAIVALSTNSTGYFNGHIALNWAFTICSVPNFECKKNIFHNYICK